MNNEYHNVIIFGAGASFDAKIPLLGSFVDTMWNYAIRGKTNNEYLTDEQKNVLNQAQELRYKLEDYSSRAYFDSRNLEDVLSLLSFEALTHPNGKHNYEVFVKAVTTTIELSCEIKYNPIWKLIDQNNVYHVLWKCLLGDQFLKSLPALITFNYDLVLERTLWDHFCTPTNSTYLPKRESCRLKYFYGESSLPIKRIRPPNRNGSPDLEIGFQPDFAFQEPVGAEIPYLKLHGSLNWGQAPLTSDEQPPQNPTMALDNPLILPPVFNKMNTSAVYQVWGKALEILRSAKHIIIVGYSLPQTDIYMQYFLKSAVGPNRNLQKVTVFDPVLFYGNDQTDKMRKRYQECFSPQFSNRIDFNPVFFNSNPNLQHLRGTFEHFVNSLTKNLGNILFIP